jgi:hypothetical protein
MALTDTENLRVCQTRCASDTIHDGSSFWNIALSFLPCEGNWLDRDSP